MGWQGSPHNAFPRGLGYDFFPTAWPGCLRQFQPCCASPAPSPHPLNHCSSTKGGRLSAFSAEAYIRKWTPPGAVVGWISPCGPANQEQPACPQANCRPLDSHQTTSLTGRACKTILSKASPEAPEHPANTLGAGMGLQPKTLTLRTSTFSQPHSITKPLCICFLT